MPRRGENIRKRKDGRWEGRYRYADSAGIVRSRSVYARTYRDVKAKLSVAKIKCGEPDQSVEKTWDEQNSITFNDSAMEWFGYIEGKRKHSTCVKYRNIYDIYIKPIIGNIRISEISQDMVNSVFPHNIEKSCSILRSISCVTNQIIKYTADRYQIACHSVVCDGNKKMRKPIEALSRSEQAKLIRYLYSFPDVSKTGILLCLSTGLRLGEICSLKWEDIDFENRILYVNRTVQRISVQNRKTRTALMESAPKSCFSKREIPITDDMVRLLQPYREDTGYVLYGSKPMEPRTYQNRFIKYLEAAGIEKTNFHILRHTFATNCIDSGTDIKSLSEILGHSDVRITLNRYVHPTTEIKRQHMNTLALIYGQYSGQDCI
ncbi:MAG: site-specific integrase [Eubacterium sp.]|nr:site-specific integrase [Eubacterium sp.]MCM1216747.1 site-specific integrase [Lachnospiraceae bacterium]MCM1238795.1 site-specific integrase [Lachnospiraceae bacterium]